MTAPLATILQDALGRDYRIEQELEGGGMSRLFVATDVRLGRRVVIKVLPPEFVSEETTARFRREIDLTVRLQHPHILPVLTSGAWEELLWYTTPYIAGESLRARLLREPKLPLDEIIKILRDVSGALAFAHARGIVHRDIKPGNILLAEGHAILADFGIARAVGTSGPRLTGSGMMLGTPAYMAPEMPTEESADVFALGVVACEMLCGELPKRGVTARELIAKRGMVAGDRRSTTRALARLIATALSEAPQQRLASATIALDQLQALSQAARPWRSTLYSVLGVTAAIAAVSAAWMHFHTPRLDADKYVLEVTGARTGPLQDLANAYGDAMTEWDGVRLVERDTVDRSASTMAPSELAVASARRQHALNAIVAGAEQVGDSIVVRATLYDARADTAVRSTRVAAPSTDAPSRVMAIRRSVNGLLRTGAELPWASAVDHAHPSLGAWRSYDAGRTALQRWDLSASQAAFRAAVTAAPAMPLAHLWLAKTLVWGAEQSHGGLPGEPLTEARRAFDLRKELDPRDSLRAAAVLALAAGDFHTRCAEAARLVADDSSDVTAWLDLGDCRAADEIVAPDARSRTGWAFESSYDGAAAAYRRAGDLGPSSGDAPFQGWLLGRLSWVLYTAPNHIRRGYRVDRDTLRFAAFPALARDSVAFEPFPISELSSGRMRPPSAAIQAAVARNRTLLRQAAEEWVRRAPRSAAAYDSLATWVEVSGGFATIDEHVVPALDVVRRARQLATDPTERLHLAVSDVRLLIKVDSFAAARVEAESLLTAGAGEHVPYVSGVDGLALLVGHPAEAARIRARSPDTRVGTARGSLVSLPAQLLDANARLLAYTSVGLHGDTVAAVIRQTETLISSYFDPAVAADLRAALLMRPLIAAYPLRSDLLRQVADTNDQVASIYRLLMDGDTAAAKRAQVSFESVARGTSLGSAIDGRYRRAALALALRDSATAIAALDPVLRALPVLDPSLLSEPPQIGSLIRALILRAELASRRDDAQTAKQCAQAVLDLWKDADPDLRPVVQEMARLSH